MLPKVTLAIPAYNEEKNLAQTIESILAQSYGDFELLLGDNCSTDGTMRIMQEFAAKDRRIRILPSDKNRGAVWNFGRLLEEARGEFFAWVGAHDRYSNDWLEELVRAISSDASVVHVYPLCRRILPDGSLIGQENQPLDTRAMTPLQRISAVCYHHGAGERIYGLFKTSCAKQCPVLAIIRWDALFLVRMAFLGNVLAVDKPLWFRYFDKVPSAKRDYQFFAKALARQYRIIYPDGTPPHMLHWLPHYYHLLLIWMDALKAFPKEGFARLQLAYYACRGHHKRNKKNVSPELRGFVRHYAAKAGILPLLRKLLAPLRG